MPRHTAYRWTYSGKKSNAFSFLFWLLVWSATSLAITMAIYVLTPSTGIGDTRDDSQTGARFKHIHTKMQSTYDVTFRRVTGAPLRVAEKPKRQDPPPSAPAKPASAARKPAGNNNSVAKTQKTKPAERDNKNKVASLANLKDKPAAKAKLSSNKPKTTAKTPIQPVNKSNDSNTPSLAAGSKTAAAGSSKFMIQAGSFSKRASAQTQQTRLAKLNIKAFIKSADVKGKRIFRVYIGPFEQAQANQMKQQMEAKNIKVFIRTRF